MTDRELLVRRTEALGRLAAQLDAVRAIHRLDTNRPETDEPECYECGSSYPCPTARAAGVPDLQGVAS